MCRSYTRNEPVGEPFQTSLRCLLPLLTNIPSDEVPDNVLEMARVPAREDEGELEAVEEVVEVTVKDAEDED